MNASTSAAGALPSGTARASLPHPEFGGFPSPTPGIGFAQWFAERARRGGSRTALSFEGRSWTYDEFAAGIDRCAALLAQAGIADGRRVAYLGFNHPHFFIALFATARLGGIFVPLNFRLTGPELEYIVNDAGAHVLLVDAHHVPVIEPIRAALRCEHTWCAHGEPPGRAGWPDLATAWSALAPHDGPPAAPSADEVAMLMYTSGTTGRPKGAMLTHGNFYWNHVNELVTIDVSRDDVLIVFAPVYHIGGLNVLTLTMLLKGAHVVLHRQFDPALILDDIVRYHASVIFAVPAMLLFMSQHPQFADADLTSLRLISCGGAPCPEPLLRLFGARGIDVQQGYGLTETAAMASTLTPEFSAARLGSVGRPAMLTQMRLIDAAGRVIDEVGARGEICVRGPNVTRGYWNQPEATRAAIDDEGWFRTGDVGYFDEEGFWYVCDRVKDMIISGGENVYPAEVESVLHGHPAIAEIAVVGAPDEKWGETVVAIAALRPGASLTLEELQAFGGERLARYKIPRRLQVVDALPRNPTGKILKYRLREALG